MSESNGIQRRRRSQQKGVQAIFTPKRDPGKGPLAAGLVATGTGAAIWMGAIQLLRGSNSTTPVPDMLSSLLPLMSLGMAFAMGGVGTLAYSLAVRRTRQENRSAESAIYELESLRETAPRTLDPTPLDQPGKRITGTPNSLHRTRKPLVVALVEAVMLLIFYGWLVQEYKANVNMQGWVHAHLSLGAYLLNDNAIFVFTAGLTSFLIFQLWPGRRRPE